MVFSRSLLLLLIISISLIHASEDHQHCTHGHNDHPAPEPMFFNEDLSFVPKEGEADRMLAGYPNIRIQATYDHLNSAPSSYKSYVQNELAPPVLAYFQAALRIKYPINGAMTVPSVQTQLCGLPTPGVLYSPGIQADFLIMFQSEMASGQGWIADSYVCFMSTTTSRPMISTTNINRANLPNPNGDVLLHEKNLYLMLHEMTHTFGFTSSMFPYFLDSNGNRRNGHIKSGYINGALATVIDVPPLTNMLRSFFGCNSLAGAYLETAGNSGSVGSHFNRRQFLFEHMTSGLLFQQRISKFTLAMLEGSGWYAPDYSYAEPYAFGAGAGCGFLFDSCSNSNFNYEEFCKDNARSCTFAGRGGGSCMSDTKSAGCKYYTPNEKYDCENPNAAQYTTVPELQVFGRGSGSRCFDGTLAKSGYNPVQSSYCFNYKCQGSGSNTILSINVGSWVVTCSEAGSVTINGYNGVLNCPDPISYCNTAGFNFCPRGCLGRGQCVNNQCNCYKGYTGTDCAISTSFGIS